jgi:hypothetical protein
MLRLFSYIKQKFLTYDATTSTAAAAATAAPGLFQLSSKV